MKFNCGKQETWGEYRDRVGQWHRWYAWYPIRTGNEECRWLEWVERKIKIVFYTYDTEFNKEYRSL